MNIYLPLENMTIEDKLNVIETIWDDLRKNAESITSPDWHAHILNERKRKVQNGSVSFKNWNEVKNNLKN